MYPNYFSFYEFMIDPDMRGDEALVPQHVYEKILEYHLPILNPIRHALGSPLYISEKSGYRSVEWEHARGRSGESQHTFSFLGACDLTCAPDLMPKLLNELIESEFPRVCWYPESDFFHCDFKFPNREKRFFEDNGNGWQYKPGVR